jgi:hypothetical protein
MCAVHSRKARDDLVERVGDAAIHESSHICRIHVTHRAEISFCSTDGLAVLSVCARARRVESSIVTVRLGRVVTRVQVAAECACDDPINATSC